MSFFELVDIGEAARRVGVSAAALRLYEREGLLPKAPRSAAGYRRYSPEDLLRARWIRRARRAGLSIREIAAALESRVCPRVLLAGHVAALEREERRISRLRRHITRWLRTR